MTLHCFQNRPGGLLGDNFRQKIQASHITTSPNALLVEALDEFYLIWYITKIPIPVCYTL